MKKILFFLLISVACYGQVPTNSQARQLLKVYLNSNESVAIYLDYKTLDNNVRYIRYDSTYQMHLVDDGTLNYRKNIVPHLLMYQKEVIDFLSLFCYKVDESMIINSEYSEYGDCGVFKSGKCKIHLRWEVIDYYIKN